MNVEGSDHRIAGRDYNESRLGSQINNSNVVNLHMPRSGEDLLSGELLTTQQQNEIRDLVRKLSDISGRDMTQVWRSFSNQFQGKMYKDLPIEWFREAYRWLKSEIEQEERKAPPPVAAYKSAAQPPTRSVVEPCYRCLTATQTLAENRRSLVLVSAMAVLAIAAAVFFGVRSQALAAEAEVARAQLSLCEYGGQSYRVGSIIDNAKAPDLECVGAPGQVASWQKLAVKAPAKRVRRG